MGNNDKQCVVVFWYQWGNTLVSSSYITEALANAIQRNYSFLLFQFPLTSELSVNFDIRNWPIPLHLRGLGDTKLHRRYYELRWMCVFWIINHWILQTVVGWYCFLLCYKQTRSVYVMKQFYLWSSCGV